MECSLLNPNEFNSKYFPEYELEEPKFPYNYPPVTHPNTILCIGHITNKILVNI